MALTRLVDLSRSWLRLPRRTARFRLTALYGGLFVLSGAALLTVTYLLFEQAVGPHAVPVPSGSPSPFPVTGTVPNQVRAATALAQRQIAAQRASDAHQLLVNSGIALAIVAVFAFVLGWFVAGRMLRPVRTITATARRISATSLQERLALQGADDEFKRLGDTLDDLFARLEAAFEAQRHFVANASHELRTPLTRERTLVQVALGDPSTSDVWRSTGQELLASNREQETLIEALLTLASSESGLAEREPVDLSDVADEVLLNPRYDADSIGIHVDTAITSAPLNGDPRLVERLVTNLLDNAIAHNIAGGQVQISTGTKDGSAVLTVTNTGPLIPASEMGRLFQPFQRLDPHRGHHKDGHGLGLSIVQAIANAHGATITAHPQAEGGLAITVVFPATTDPEPAVDARRDRGAIGP